MNKEELIIVIRDAIKEVDKYELPFHCNVSLAVALTYLKRLEALEDE